MAFFLKDEPMFSTNTVIQLFSFFNSLAAQAGVVTSNFLNCPKTNRPQHIRLI